jgi:hypothetical protein
MERNFRYVDGKNQRPLEFSVVNAGNVREFLMTLSANAAMMWGFQEYDTDKFLTEFCTQYFGVEHASDVADLYRDFFNSYWQQKQPDLEGFQRQYIFQDMRYARAIEQITGHFSKGYTSDPLQDRAAWVPIAGEYFRVEPKDSGTENQLEAIIKGTDTSIAKLEQIVARAEDLFDVLPATRRVFFKDNLLVQAKFMLHLNETLHAVTRAFMTLESGANQQTIKLLDLAVTRLDAAQHALDQAEHSRFSGWYDTDTKFKMNDLDKRIRDTRTSVLPAGEYTEN